MRHGFRITRRDIDAAERSLARDPAPESRGKSGGGTAGKVVSSFESLAASFGVGLFQGRFGHKSLGPVPYELLGYLGLTGSALFGIGGERVSEHVMAFGTGVGCAYTHTLGGMAGTMLAMKAGKPLLTERAKGPKAGEETRSLGAGRPPLTEAELRALAHAVR